MNALQVAPIDQPKRGKFTATPWFFFIAMAAVTVVGVALPEVTEGATLHSRYIKTQEDVDRLRATWGRDAQGAAASHCANMKRRKMCMRDFVTEFKRRV